MAKVVGSYASVTRGVSEQVPQDRHSGQMWEQVNMISDPVVGLTRRPGSRLMADIVAANVGTSITAAMQADLRLYRDYTFFHRGKEYVLLYRNASASAPTATPPLICYCKTDNFFLGVRYADGNTSIPSGAGAAIQPWITGGVSAVTSIGDYLCVAANTLGPGYTVSDKYATTSMWGVAWVRGGAYSRSYTLKITRRTDGTVFTAQYTTMSSSYPNLLNTSDIPSGATDYQKQINDRVNAYNSAVNQWVGQAQQSIQPQYIASQLVTQMTNAGYNNIGIVGGTIFMDNVTSVSCDDGGDGTLFRGVFNTLDDVSKLSSIHGNGKVVQIKSSNQVDPYYMVFKTDDPAAYYGTGKWTEGPAQIVQPGQVFAVAGITADNSTLVIGSTPAVLNAQGFTCPTFAGSVCGDQSQKGAIPYFFGKKISLLTVFQDRLVIVSDGTIFMSRTGDYFNWYRQTMLSVQDDDPIEVYALGAADDVISKAVTWNKNLFLFGQRNQYSVPGAQAVTPQTISVSTVASEHDANNCQPVSVGNLVFYGSQKAMSDQIGASPYAGQVSQFQLGLFQDTPETYQVSKQLSRYMRGRPTQMATISTPPTLFTRTDGLDNGFYVYSFIDAPGTQERQFDSWSRWECSASMGQLIAITPFQQDLLAFWLMPSGAAGYADQMRLRCTRFTMDSTSRDMPFFDGLSTMDATAFTIQRIIVAGNAAGAAMWPDAYVALGSSNPAFLNNTQATKYAAFSAQYPSATSAQKWVGFDFASYATLTPPYVRDNNDKAIVNGRLVVNKYTVSLTNSAGCDATITDVNGTDAPLAAYNGRIVGQSNNLVGSVPISTSTWSVPVGRANTEHKVSLRSRTGLPMAISAIEWVGQFFTSGRRV